MRSFSFDLVVLFCLVLALSAVAPGVAQPSADEALPYERTEDIETCRDYDPDKQAFFGTTHLHTARSFDASIFYVPAGPREAYRYAKKEVDSIAGADAAGRLTRSYPAPERPLDWGTVTDHAEYFSVMSVCIDPEAPGFQSLECRMLRGFYYQPGSEDVPGSDLPADGRRSLAANVFSVLSSLVLSPSSRIQKLPLCENHPEDCARLERDGVWAEMQDAAEEAYEPCKFTSFVGYEVSAAPSSVTWHRNVIFRNADVIDVPVTAVDMAREPNTDPDTLPPSWAPPPDVEKLWDALDKECLQADGVCDVLTIPHNSNLGGGLRDLDGNELVPPAFFDPADREAAEKRQRWEPLVEIFQAKGSSECRLGVGTTDEDCQFELLDRSLAGDLTVSGAEDEEKYPRRSWVRKVLEDGLVFQQDRENFGVNPFKLGIVAASDSHNGTMGWYPENEDFAGHAGARDASPTSGEVIQDNAGGYSVVWAEENTRDAIFTALRNKETYGTSGTRILVRFFGGWDFPDDLCSRDFPRIGYEQGVPMGGDLPPRSGDGGPRFFVGAWADELIGTPLAKVQIIKGWVDAEGDTHEEVIRVAGGDKTHDVTSSCEREGEGYEELCTVWEDPEFDPEVPAFYYARVLENTVCRWSTRRCQEKYGVNPLAPLRVCSEQLEALGRKEALEAKECCSNMSAEGVRVQPKIQERAWTSPIWYTPAD